MDERPVACFLFSNQFKHLGVYSTFIGTSGFSYPHWSGLLYAGVPQPHWLTRYAEVFKAVELNFTFYRLPSEKAVRRWHAQTPPDFVFAVKGSRFITHQKRLVDCRSAVRAFFKPLKHLKDKLHVVLWQLPPSFLPNQLSRLKSFARLLPLNVLHAFEFRNPEWYEPKIYSLLDDHGFGLCEHDALTAQPIRPTGNFRYLRFHRPQRYGARRLRGTALELQTSNKRAYVFFNNDYKGYAVYDALTLRRLLDSTSAMGMDRTRF